MIIYLVVFLLSYLFLKISQYQKNKIIRNVYIIIALLLPSCLAGFRDYSIGVDVEVYGNIWFQQAVEATHARGMEWYVNWAVSSSVGALYATLNYIIALFTDNPHWFYFWLNFITNCLIYKAAKDNEDMIDSALVMLVYYSFFYNLSFNLLRQSLAMSFAACTFIYIRKQRLFPFICFSVMAILAHSSAIVVIIPYLVYRVINSKFNKIWEPIILIGSTISILGFFKIVQILINNGIISNRYESYLNINQRGGGIVRLFLLCLPYLILLLFYIKENLFKREGKALTYYLIFSTLISFLAFKMTYITRIAYYFDIFLIFTVPYIIQNNKFIIKFKERNISGQIVLGVVWIYWLFVYVIRHSGETVPYIFMKY